MQNVIKINQNRILVLIFYCDQSFNNKGGEINENFDIYKLSINKNSKLKNAGYKYIIYIVYILLYNYCIIILSLYI